ncbi:hypothetical protein BTVI_09139 [Pitangus sulphuratus]|nr:hypothetical protein BTVI_09139 [Pitangus sulphuratus]
MVRSSSEGTGEEGEAVKELSTLRECFDCTELKDSGDKVECPMAERKQSGRFLKRVEDNFLLQLQDQLSSWKPVPELVDRDREQNKPHVIQEEVVSHFLSHLDQSMGPDGIHLGILRELVEELAKLLSIIYHQSWLTGQVPDDWRLANVMDNPRKGWKQDLGN